jgi:hypothetical protein
MKDSGIPGKTYKQAHEAFNADPHITPDYQHEALELRKIRDAQEAELRARNEELSVLTAHIEALEERLSELHDIEHEDDCAWMTSLKPCDCGWLQTEQLLSRSPSEAAAHSLAEHDRKVRRDALIEAADWLESIESYELEPDIAWRGYDGMLTQDVESLLRERARRMQEETND